MTEVVADAVVRLRTDDTGVETGARAAGTKAGSTAGKGFLTSFKGAAAGFLAAAGLQAGAQQVVSFFKGAVGAAGDLNETMSKTGVVFGGASKDVVAFASQGAQVLGQTKKEALDAASTFGVFGKAAGLSGDDLSSFSTDLVGLSTDLASFHNARPEEVVQALGSALRGESEPMRRFGVLLDDATLKQEAMRQGLIKTTKEALTPQQKTLAAQALIMAKTKDAQGDFARTSGGLANQQRILSAQFKEVQTSVGQALLPAVLAIVKGFNQLLSGTSPISPVLSALGNVIATVLWPALQQVWAAIITVAGAFVTLFGFISSNWQVFAVIAGVILTALVPAMVAWAVQAGITLAITVTMWVTSAASAVANAAIMLAQMTLLGLSYIKIGIQALAAGAQMAAGWLLALGPIGLIIAAVVAVVAVIVILWKKSETFRQIVTGAWEGVKKAVMAVVNFIKGPVKSFFTSTLPNFFRNGWERVKSITMAVLKGMLIVLGGWPVLVFNIIRRLGPTLVNIMRNAWSAAKNAVVNGLNNIMSFIRSIPGKIAGLAGSFLSAGKNLGSKIISGIGDGLRAAGGFVTNLASSVKNAINSALHLPVTIKGPGPLPDFTIPAFASGTMNFPGGVGLVGERGPEMVALPRGTAIFTAAQTRALLGGQSTSAPARVREAVPAQTPVKVFIDGAEVANRIEMSQRRVWSATSLRRRA